MPPGLPICPSTPGEDSALCARQAERLAGTLQWARVTAAAAAVASLFPFAWAPPFWVPLLLAPPAFPWPRARRLNRQRGA